MVEIYCAQVRILPDHQYGGCIAGEEQGPWWPEGSKDAQAATVKEREVWGPRRCVLHRVAKQMGSTSSALHRQSGTASLPGPSLQGALAFSWQWLAELWQHVWGQCSGIIGSRLQTPACWQRCLESPSTTQSMPNAAWTAGVLQTCCRADAGLLDCYFGGDDTCGQLPCCLF